MSAPRKIFMLIPWMLLEEALIESHEYASYQDDESSKQYSQGDIEDVLILRCENNVHYLLL
jgi:hypothetical protein